MAVFLDPPKQFQTTRLTLRIADLADADQLHKSYMSKPHIPRYMSWVAHTHIDQTTVFLKHCIKCFLEKSNFEFVMELNEKPGTGIGMIGMNPLENGVGFGYVLAEDYWNQGLTSEALCVLVDWSLSQREVFRAQAFCDVENQASARVMEKAGMTFEGRLKRYFVYPNLSKEPRDSLIYAKVK